VPDHTFAEYRFGTDWGVRHVGGSLGEREAFRWWDCRYRRFFVERSGMESGIGHDYGFVDSRGCVVIVGIMKN
jgi:hypothetical protein